jgi:hypothetical protein
MYQKGARKTTSGQVYMYCIYYSIFKNKHKSKVIDLDFWSPVSISTNQQTPRHFVRSFPWVKMPYVSIRIRSRASTVQYIIRNTCGQRTISKHERLIAQTVLRTYVDVDVWSFSCGVVPSSRAWHGKNSRIIRSYSLLMCEYRNIGRHGRRARERAW